MTATDRAALLFQLSHVIGPAPDTIIEASLYTPLATVISYVQLILIAVRGRRSYTKPEFERIFNKGFITIFGAMEYIRSQTYRKRLRAWSRSSCGDAPKRFKREERYSEIVLKQHRNISANTEDKIVYNTDILHPSDICANTDS